MKKRSLLTKHGKYYELNPYRIIQALEDIIEESSTPLKFTEGIDNLQEQIYEELDLPR
jgi:hypothetical protein